MIKMACERLVRYTEKNSPVLCSLPKLLFDRFCEWYVRVTAMETTSQSSFLRHKLLVSMHNISSSKDVEDNNSDAFDRQRRFVTFMLDHLLLNFPDWVERNDMGCGSESNIEGGGQDEFQTKTKQLQSWSEELSYLCDALSQTWFDALTQKVYHLLSRLCICLENSLRYDVKGRAVAEWDVPLQFIETILHYSVSVQVMLTRHDIESLIGMLRSRDGVGKHTPYIVRTLSSLIVHKELISRKLSTTRHVSCLFRCLSRFRVGADLLDRCVSLWRPKDVDEVVSVESGMNMVDTNACMEDDRACGRDCDDDNGRDLVDGVVCSWSECILDWKKYFSSQRPPFPAFFPTSRTMNELLSTSQ
eukprot:m.143787 g.143787  ORF g.143787 m.143787 type:complete len:359 (-) comp13213_c1_seq1:150-1226(-)